MTEGVFGNDNLSRSATELKQPSKSTSRKFKLELKSEEDLKALLDD
jgi:hypothetical protein